MKAIVTFGDSNTWGFDYTTYSPDTGVRGRFAFEERWPGYLQNLLGNDYRIIENALNSRTIVTEDPCIPFRRGIDSLKVALESNAPLDLVIIQLGANECKTMYSRSPGAIAFGLDHMIRACKQSYYTFTPPKILIVAPAPFRADSAELVLGFNYGPDAYAKSVALAKEYEIVAKRHGCGFFDPATLDFELNTVDGVHYSKNDHAKLATALAPLVRELLL